MIDPWEQTRKGLTATNYWGGDAYTKHYVSEFKSLLYDADYLLAILRRLLSTEGWEENMTADEALEMADLLRSMPEHLWRAVE